MGVLPKATRVLIIVRNLPVPFDRRVWLKCQALVAKGYQVAVVCPNGSSAPGYSVLDTAELYKYRPHAPGGNKAGSSPTWSAIRRAWSNNVVNGAISVQSVVPGQAQGLL